MSFKCKKCKRQSKKKKSQFKKTYTRVYLTEENQRAKQISKEDLVCYACWKESEDKYIKEVKGAVNQKKK